MVDTDSAIKKVEELTEMVLAGKADQVVKILGEPLYIESFSSADVMRGVANQAIPKSWDWEIAECVGGECRLIITGIRDA